MSKSRTNNVSRNAVIGVTCQIIYLLLTFVARKYFIQFLGREYLGLNGLFSSVLSILSLAELGFSSAIVAHLYKPIAEKNYEKIKTLMRLYRNVYCSIGIFVISLSAVVMPFLPLMMKKDLTIDVNIFFAFGLFALNSASSYFFAYHTSLINAYQKKYIVDSIRTSVYIVKDIALILVLYFTKNFYLYLMVTLVSTIITYVTITFVCRKIYPFLKDKKCLKLEKSEIRSIYISVGSLVIYKLAWTLLASTTDIFISSFIGVDEVGLVSNYVLFSGQTVILAASFTNAFTSSIGEFNVNKPIKEQEKLFNVMFLIVYWIASFCAISLMLFADKVILLMSDSSYVMEWYIGAAVALNFYVVCMAYPTSAIRITKNLFSYNKIAPVAAILIHIGLSLTLGHFFGIFGFLIAMPITRILTFGLIDPFITYKYGFEGKPGKYYLRYFTTFVFTAINCGITYLVINLIKGDSYIIVAIQMVVSIIVSNILILISVCWTKEFRIVFKKIQETVRNILMALSPGRRRKTS